MKGVCKTNHSLPAVVSTEVYTYVVVAQIFFLLTAASCIRYSSTYGAAPGEPWQWAGVWVCSLQDLHIFLYCLSLHTWPQRLWTGEWSVMVCMHGVWDVCMHGVYALCDGTAVYALCDGTALILTLMGQKKVSCLLRCPYFRG